MRSRFSGKPFVRAYQCEKQQAFFDGHLHAFAFFGGVFPTLVYDNLKSAVQKILSGRGRVEQESFQRFRAYYTFEARFCNAGCGNEKGGTEGLVGYARRNFLVPVPVVDSLAELNEKLLEECIRYGDHRIAGREDTVRVHFEKEKDHLLALPEAINELLTGDYNIAKSVLRDYINATITFPVLAQELHKSSKSIHRMLGPNGNPRMDSIAGILKVLQSKECIKLQTNTS